MPVLRIHRLSPAQCCLQRNLVAIRKLVQERILAGQIVRHLVLFLIRNLHHVFAGIQPVLPRLNQQVEILALNQRFGEVNRIAGDADVRQVVAMPDEMLHQSRLIAFRQPIPSNPTLLDVRRIYSQDIAFPFAGGETHPGVRGVFGGMRPVIQPNGPSLFVRADVILDRDRSLRLRIALLPNVQVQRPAINVRSHVHLALMLGQRQA